MSKLTEPAAGTGSAGTGSTESGSSEIAKSGIERLLIANRGEIARRIMRTCRELGIETVAIYSDADADAAFVQDADLSVPLGGNTPAESYLRIDAIVEAAQQTGADAVHPGYGFLAENEAFVRAVEQAGLTFVGPSAEAIAVMGSKLEAKRRMADAGVPLLPSADLTGLDEAQVASAAEEIGYPILIKASAGGGGRGMRIVEQPADLAEAVAGAGREATSAFGDGTIYAERYVSPSRHVEVQIFGDDSGRVVHFHERECSIQRRHQKIIEEAPSDSLDDETRQALHAAAVTAGEAIGYTNAGTVEFLLGPRVDGRSEFYFLEVNTRLQVEHPVTEAILDVDLVRLQLEVAAGGSVPAQSEIGPVSGHAMEARLYAEDPTNDFLPSTGTVRVFSVPDGVRLDTAIDSTNGSAAPDAAPNGSASAAPAGEISQFYDPMMAKVIAHGPTRTAAARRLASALAATVIDGIASNRDLLVRTLRHPEFLGDQGDSDFLIRNPSAELGRPLIEGDDLVLASAAAALAMQVRRRGSDRHTAAVNTGFRNVATAPQRVDFSLGDRRLAVGYRFERGSLSGLEVDGVALESPTLYSATADRVDLAVAGVRRQFDVQVFDGHQTTVSVIGPAGAVTLTAEPRFAEPESSVDPGSTVATMPGTIAAVNVKQGDVVAEGDVLLVMEAMKMELTVAAATAGVVALVGVSAGDSVEAGTVLVVIEEQTT